MGKHKSHKQKKHKHHKEKKKHKKEYSSSSEEEWVEKKNSSSSSEEETKKTTRNPEEGGKERDEWMNLCTKFSSTSHLDRRREKEEAKKLDNIKKQYNPRECSRELNPYWKDGGDGLPKFLKPTEDSTKEYVKRSDSFRAPNWKKQTPSSSTEHKSPEKGVKETTNDPKIDLNALAAKLVKAEIMGNQKLVAELKQQLEEARNQQSQASKEENQVILTHTDSKGHSRPVREHKEYGEPSRKKSKKVETHENGERMRYFADDDKYSLKQMFENEKYNTVEEQNTEFLKAVSKVKKNDDLDDVFSENIRKKDLKVDERNKNRAIQEHQSINKRLDGCNRCIQSDSMQKHLMVSMAETAYISLPSHEPLTEGHCLIIPIKHTTCSTQLDENEWNEIKDMQKMLINMFMARNEDVVFFETAMNLHRFPHMCIECVPLPKEEGDLAPIYFKKAIDESEMEWAQNRKLVPLRGRDVRRAIPKGLPYFMVSFGLDDGYAHVIEDEQLFPGNFAQEIIGGMLDLHHSKWKRPKKQHFDEQSRRVLSFSQEWNKFNQLKP